MNFWLIYSFRATTRRHARLPDPSTHPRRRGEALRGLRLPPHRHRRDRARGRRRGGHALSLLREQEIGRASCRERVENWGGGVSIKEKKGKRKRGRDSA